METAQIKAHLQSRLQQLVAQKLQLDEKVNTLGERVEVAIRRAGPRPPGAIEKIEKEIAQQEYYRSTTTMPLNQEKLLLRQQDAAKHKIRLIKVNKDCRLLRDCVFVVLTLDPACASQEHAAAEEGVQELRTKRLLLVEERAQCNSQINELQAGLNKLELAEKAGVSVADLVTIVVEVPADKVRCLLFAYTSVARRSLHLRRCDASI
jgi:uncharacterized coiled-coil DUF342 family protein